MALDIEHIFRWDLDKTYLRTEFDSFGDLVRTARMTAEERENVPGSAALLRAIRGGVANLIYFISGSPQQLRGVIEKKFEIDGFAPDGFVLKPAVSMLFRGRFRALRSQVPYKLGALLTGRADAPIGARETLFGDDAESDAFVYSLYADIISGKVDATLVRTILDRSGAYAEQIEYIEHELLAVVHEPAVKRIVIHLDQLTPPAAFADYFPRVVPIYNHLQTAIVLYLDGTLGPEAILHVAEELVREYDFDALRLTNSAEDILRRKRSSYPTGHLERLAAELEVLRGGPEISEPTKDTLARIAERATYLAGRPLPESEEPEPELDYLALYEQDEARREEQRRAKKLAQRQTKR